MIKNVFGSIVRLVRQGLGIERILKNVEQLQILAQKQRGALLETRHLLDRAISFLEYADIDEERMRSSEKYQRCFEIISLLSPLDLSDAKYRRVGRDYDGGYVMLDEFSSRTVQAAYSFGINKDVSWDEVIASMDIDVYMYDHTIPGLPKENPKFHFFKKGVTGHDSGPDLETLSELIVKNGHRNFKNLILKMDIEGCEWDVFDETPSDVIDQFSQIVIELHGLSPNRSNIEFQKIVSVLKKLNETHQSIHVHANGYSEVAWVGGLALPNLMEVTYVRRASYAGRLISNERNFPTPIDQPTYFWVPEVPLGKFTPPVSYPAREQ